MEIKNKIFEGNALDVLRTFPEKSVSMAITSPPYWGLRDYQSKDTIWDSDACDEHDFSVVASPRRNRNVEDVKDQTTIQAGNVGSQHDLPETTFCSACSAWKGSLGLEPSFDLYIKHLCDIFEETKRVLKDTGTLWVNLGDTYGGTGAGHSKSPQGKNKQTDGQYLDQDKAYTLKHNATRGLSKSLVGIPFRFAIEMLERGWILRNTIVWHKRNCMPSSIRDRFTVDFEYVFFFSKNKKYFFNQQFEPHTSGDENSTRIFRPGTKSHSQLINKEISHGKRSEKENENIIMKYGEQGRNKRTVWTINTKPFPEAHFATFPEELIKTPILAGCPEFICKKCNVPKEKKYKVIGKSMEWIKDSVGDTTADYKGTETKDYKSALANEPSKAKKSILESMSEIKEPYYTDCGCNAGFDSGIVLDMFMGSGTTAVVALKNNRSYVGIEMSNEYMEIANKRIDDLRIPSTFNLADLFGGIKHGN
jgi:site-specific DNA-methyltransferase (adenine-specific)